MIARVWHGWTRPENADEYERLLRDEFFPEIARRDLPGYHGVDLLRRDGDEEVEFKTVMWFDSDDGIRAFTGEDREVPQFAPRARELLSRFREQARHYDVRERISY